MDHLNGSGLVVWRPGHASVNGWREAEVFLGRIPTAFRIDLQTRRSKGLRGDVAVDQLEFLDCALPGELPRSRVGQDHMTGGRAGAPEG